MARHFRIRGRRRLRLLAALGLILALSSPGIANAETGSVNVTATNNAKITISISDAAADLGTNLDPEGTDSNGVDTVLDYQGSSGSQGSYYVWKSGGAGLSIAVKSNKVWDGTVAASENSGTAASMSIASGVLRYCATTAPTSYVDAAACSSMSTTAAAPTAWSSHAKGMDIFTYFYAFRVDWNDDPGTFTSAITYTVSQQ